MFSQQKKCYRLLEHQSKRFMLQLAERSPRLGEDDSIELMDSSLCASKRAGMQPTEELLREHTLRASQLPRLYAGSAVVLSILDRLARAESEIQRAVEAMSDALEARPDAEIDLEGGFEFLAE